MAFIHVHAVLPSFDMEVDSAAALRFRIGRVGVLATVKALEEVDGTLGLDATLHLNQATVSLLNPFACVSESRADEMNESLAMATLISDAAEKTQKAATRIANLQRPQSSHF